MLRACFETSISFCLHNWSPGFGRAPRAAPWRATAPASARKEAAMSMLRKLGLAALVVICCPWSFSQAGVYVGIGVPGPYYYRPYYRPWYGGVYVAPPPVVVG